VYAIALFLAQRPLATNRAALAGAGAECGDAVFSTVLPIWLFSEAIRRLGAGSDGGDRLTGPGHHHAARLGSCWGESLGVLQLAGAALVVYGVRLVAVEQRLKSCRAAPLLCWRDHERDNPRSLWLTAVALALLWCVGLSAATTGRRTSRRSGPGRLGEYAGAGAPATGGVTFAEKPPLHVLARGASMAQFGAVRPPRALPQLGYALLAILCDRGACARVKLRRHAQHAAGAGAHHRAVFATSRWFTKCRSGSTPTPCCCAGVCLAARRHVRGPQRDGGASGVGAGTW